MSAPSKVTPVKKEPKKHQANKELAHLISREITTFFSDTNTDISTKYFTTKEIEDLKKSSYSKKRKAIFSKLSSELAMSESTFYHMLEGKNSQFDKVVNVLDFFGLELHYNVFSKNKSTTNETFDNKETEELVAKVLSLDGYKKTLLSNLIDTMN